MTLASTKFNGTISRGTEAFAVTFEVLVGEDARLKLNLEPLELSAYSSVVQAIGEPGTFAESLTLEGRGLRGEAFYSDTVEVSGFRSGPAGNRIAVSAREGRLRFSCDPVPRPRTRLWLRGFKSFHTPSVSMSLGEIFVRGPVKLSSPDEASGTITVQAAEGTSLENWLERADEFLTFMHRGLAFSRGARLQAPRLDILHGNILEHHFYAGDAFRAGLAPIDHRDQGDFIKALAVRFDKGSEFPEILWRVTGWLHSDSVFDEARFLMSMTSLEAAVEHLLPEPASTIISKSLFEPLRDDLLAALQEHQIAESAVGVIQSKIRQLNSRSLYNKIQGLRDHYQLPIDVFTDAKIKEVVVTRNDVVHQGGSPGRRDVWPLIIFVRDFLTQIVFQEIGYAGRHQRFTP